MYRYEQINELMTRSGVPFTIKRLSRDFFVTMDASGRS